jgi:hypothetical protein
MINQAPSAITTSGQKMSDLTQSSKPRLRSSE